MKERLDVLLVKRGLAPSREKAKALIRAGCVYVQGKQENKAGAMFGGEEEQIVVKDSPFSYVSRGGLKLEKALSYFPVSLAGKVCMDIGASAGGFTDCMLQNGAARVYAVDAGQGQLVEKLRSDERVICMEGTNFRYMTKADLAEEVAFASADVSFISLTKILIPARCLLAADGQMICLIKPQFEAGRGKVGKKGVVKDPAVHRDVIGKIVDFADIAGFAVLGLTFSPIRGPEGNIEYLLWLQKDGRAGEGKIRETEQEAEEELARVRTLGGGISAGAESKKLIVDVVKAAGSSLSG